MTFAFASRVASASAAMARCNCTGSLTSLISTRSALLFFILLYKSNINI